MFLSWTFAAIAALTVMHNKANPATVTMQWHVHKRHLNPWLSLLYGRFDVCLKSLCCTFVASHCEFEDEVCC